MSAPVECRTREDVERELDESLILLSAIDFGSAHGDRWEAFEKMQALQAELASLSEPTPRVPNGGDAETGRDVRVPREPTIAMLQAGYHALKSLYPRTDPQNGGGPIGQYAVWEAMYDAACVFPTLTQPAGANVAGRDYSAEAFAKLNKDLDDAETSAREAKADVAALREAEAFCETVRLHLINDLEEPGRTVFWQAVSVRDRLRTALAGRVPSAAPDAAAYARGRHDMAREVYALHEDTVKQYHDIGQSDDAGKAGAFARGRCTEAKSIARAISCVVGPKPAPSPEQGREDAGRLDHAMLSCFRVMRTAEQRFRAMGSVGAVELADRLKEYRETAAGLLRGGRA